MSWKNQDRSFWNCHCLFVTYHLPEIVDDRNKN
jgi:hypothetical protein